MNSNTQRIQTLQTKLELCCASEAYVSNGYSLFYLLCIHGGYRPTLLLVFEATRLFWHGFLHFCLVTKVNNQLDLKFSWMSKSISVESPQNPRALTLRDRGQLGNNMEFAFCR